MKLFARLRNPPSSSVEHMISTRVLDVNADPSTQSLAEKAYSQGRGLPSRQVGQLATEASLYHITDSAEDQKFMRDLEQLF